VILADAFVRSRLLDTFVNDPSHLNVHRKDRAEKLKRRLHKVCQYNHGIDILIRRARRFLSIPHYWVTDAFSGSEEGVFSLCDDVHDAVARGIKEPTLSQEHIDTLSKRFPDIQTTWAIRQTVHTCVHAELRIILHLSPPYSASTVKEYASH
jgi:hypothetical protein